MLQSLEQITLKCENGRNEVPWRVYPKAYGAPFAVFRVHAPNDS